MPKMVASKRKEARVHPALQLLVKHGADVNAKTKAGKTALQEVTKDGNTAAISWLLKQGADPNAKTTRGETALHWAADYGNVNAVKLLLKRGAEANARTVDGETPLHWAMRSEQSEVEKLLCEHGADPVADEFGVRSQAAMVGGDWHHASGKIWGLLIGIDSYQKGDGQKDGASYASLRGCVNDINLVEQYLRGSMNLEPSRIKKLVTEPQAEAHEAPTYNNIVKALLSVTDEAAPGDSVYVHYSGHGGSVPTAFPSLSGKGRWDGVLIPTDINCGGQFLRDLELQYLLTKMVEKGVAVTVVLDCNYPTQRRSDDSVRAVFDQHIISDDEFVPSTDVPAASAKLVDWVAQQVRQTRGKGLVLERLGYSMFVTSVAVEIEKDGVHYGALTHSLLKALRSYSMANMANPSCRTILRRMRA